MTNTADKLLDAMSEVVAKYGPSGVTLRRVGAEAGLSHTAAAHYYGDKPGLFTAYITRSFNTVAEGMEAALMVEPDRAAFLQAARSYAEFAIERPSEFSVMNRLELARVDTPELWAARERGFFALAALIERSQQAGWAQSRDGLDLIATTWGLVHGFVDLWVGGPLAAPYDPAELVPTLLRVVEDLLDALDD